MTEFSRDVIETQIRERNLKANNEFRISAMKIFRDVDMFECRSIKEINEKYSFNDRGWTE